MVLKTAILFVTGMFLALSSQGQDTIPLYSDVVARLKIQPIKTPVSRPAIGIDLCQALWSIYTGAQHTWPATYAYPVSITLYLPTKRTAYQDRMLYVNAGYVAYGGTLQRNMYQSGGSMHVRVGVESTRDGLILGYSGLLTGWSGQGSYFFTGKTFGNYQEPIGTFSGVALGGEGNLGYAMPFSNRLSLRTSLRGSMLCRLSANPFGLYAPTLSGVDWSATDRQLGIAISLQANLVFQL